MPKPSQVPTISQRFHGIVTANGANAVLTKDLVQALVDVHHATLAELLEDVAPLVDKSALQTLKTQYLP